MKRKRGIIYDNESRIWETNKLPRTVSNHQQDVGDKMQIEDRSASDVAAGSSSSIDTSHGVESFNLEKMKRKRAIVYDDEGRSWTTNKLPRTVLNDQQDVGDKVPIEDRSASDVAAGSSSSIDTSHGVESFNFEKMKRKQETVYNNESRSWMTNKLPRTFLNDQQDVGDKLQIEDRRTSDVAAGSSSSTHPSHGVESFDFEAFLNQDEKFPISDKRYIEEMELQEALMMSTSASLIPSPSEYAATSSSTDYLPFFPYSSSTNLPFIPYVTYESSQVPDKFCGICMDTKTEFEMFINDNVCGHTFCIDCIRSHIGAKINENVANVRCPDPDCKGLIGPNVCRYIIPEEVLERWDHALCESLIMGSQKLYCPYKDCSAPLLVDENGVATKDTECPHCNRMFCAQCKVPWHSKMDCKEFQMLNENGEINKSDRKVLKLAKENKWQRCPKCSYYVARTHGCNHMSCRCGHNFCYACGSTRGECSCGA